MNCTTDVSRCDGCSENMGLICAEPEVFLFVVRPQRAGSGRLRKRRENSRKSWALIKRPDKAGVCVCRSWYQSYLSVFFTGSLCCFSPYLTAPKCQEQKDGEEIALCGLFMGPHDKMLMLKSRPKWVPRRVFPRMHCIP